jgi:hypothetical protein
MHIITVTQIEAARRQLHTAIDLWVTDGDPVSIHTLAFCAYQITHDLNRANKGRSMVLDYEHIPKDGLSSWVNFIKTPSNFFKHADNRKSKTRGQSVTLKDELTLVLMWYAAWGLEELGEPPTPHVIAFRGTLIAKHPDFVDPDQAKPVQDYFAANPAERGYLEQSKKAIFDDVMGRVRARGL